jgi:hypothetical protein
MSALMLGLGLQISLKGALFFEGQRVFVWLTLRVVALVVLTLFACFGASACFRLIRLFSMGDNER